MSGIVMERGAHNDFRFVDLTARQEAVELAYDIFEMRTDCRQNVDMG